MGSSSYEPFVGEFPLISIYLPEPLLRDTRIFLSGFLLKNRGINVREKDDLILEYDVFFYVGTYVSVQLTNEAREIVVFEINWEQFFGEFRWVPNHEAVTTFAP